MIALGLVVLLGIVALAIDGGSAFVDRRRAQSAADAAALAGALARINGEAWEKITYQVAAQNGFNNDGVTNVVQVYSPPADGQNYGNIEYIQVQITAYTKTYFAQVVGISRITNFVEADSRTTTPVKQPMFNGAAIVSMAPISDCGSYKAFYIHNEATLSITGGGIFINSNNKDCALIEQGSGSIRIMDNHTISIVGGASIQKPKLLTPFPPATGAAPVTVDPLPFYMPKVTCPNVMAKISEDGESMSAGNWDDIFPPPGVKKLGQGIYCLNSDFILNSDRSLSGSNVTFKIEHGSMRWESGAHVDLEAPVSGDLAGLLIYQPVNNTSVMVLNGNGDSHVMGTIFAPGAQIRIKGNSSNYGFHSQIIGYLLDVDGIDNIIVKYLPDQNFQPLSMPAIQFTK